MAGITKVNPAATTLGYEVVGKDVQFFTIDYIQAIDAKTGPNSAQKAVLDVIGTTSTILSAGPLGTTRCGFLCNLNQSLAHLIFFHRT